MSALVGGLGREIDTLRVAYRVASEIDDRALEHEVGLTLAEALGRANQPDEAIAILEALAVRDDLTPRLRFATRFVLAARLSETRKVAAIRRAREIGEEQVKELDAEHASVDAQTVWMNLGNFRRLDGDPAGAKQAFERALSLCPPAEPNQVPLQLGQITALLAEVEIMLGDVEQGKRRLAEADMIFQRDFGVTKLHYESLAGRLSLELGEPLAAVEHAERAISARRMILAKGPSPRTWEAMLREWARIDVLALKAQHSLGSDANLEKALLVAEGAKGRLYGWLSRARIGDPQASAQALDEGIQVEALARARRWTSGGRRWVVSLFADRSGLSILGLGTEGRVTGKWLADCDYDDLRLRIFEPLERGLDDALAGHDRVARDLSAGILDLLLHRIGSWLARAIPDLTSGGEELVLLPHRLLRSLPLAHAELPNGQRLSQIFDRVSTCPSLAALAAQLDAEAKERSPSASALVNPDGSLPFAELEGLASLGVAETLRGSALSSAALKSAFEKPGTLLLSCHGSFDEGNPWQSKVTAADGDIVLGDLLIEHQTVGADVVVLGACEAGKSRRSLSDEPLSFPTMLSTLGARMVIAPLWEVEDLASYLMVTHLLREMRAGAHPSSAVARAAHRLRRLTAANVLSELRGVAADLAENRFRFEPSTQLLLQRRLEEYMRWLADDLEPTDYPFDTLDWSAYQAFGFIFH